MTDPLSALSVAVESVDHIGFNVFEGEMIPATEWYERTLGFHRFFSIDDSIVHSEYSGLRSIAVADPDEAMKVVLIEPAPGTRKSQIEEFIEHYGGQGAQHVALITGDIIASARALEARGADLLPVTPHYYTELRTRLRRAPIEVKEDIDRLSRFNIMLDYDAGGYLLQMFTRPLSDRPTFFVELIQRNQHAGFGANNFKAIFEAIEDEQKKRGNLS